MSTIQAAIDTARVAYQAGFRGSALVMAIAIAGAESTFNSDATGDVALQDQKWGPSVGLWQIRTLKPAYLSLEPIRDVTKLYDPLENAKAAYAISKKGTNWRPWSTFLNKDYEKWITTAKESVSSIIEETKKKSSSPNTINCPNCNHSFSI